ncbi:MAG: galactose mutarotase, partial [Firmicutes bacterium]|nr:galactose mutarotase [Bacillota bacterium]
GVIGFDKVLWQAETSNIDNNSILLKYCSPHNQEGFVGNLNISVQYKWDDCNQLTMNITAVSDQDTICNITNHAYFNLDGHNSGHLNNHTIQIKSTKILDIDKNNLPTGNFISVKNTDLDLNQPKQLDNLNLPHRLIQQCSGYDFSYCLNNNDFTKSIQPKHIATAQSMTSGISLQLYTTKPTVQFYTGNSIQQNTKGKSGINYEKYSAFCLEPQFCPDAPNHKNLGDTILRVGKEYSHCNIYKIGIT